MTNDPYQNYSSIDNDHYLDAKKRPVPEAETTGFLILFSGILFVLFLRYFRKSK